MTIITSQISKKTSIDSSMVKISGKRTIGIKISDKNIMKRSENIEFTVSLIFPRGSRWGTYIDRGREASEFEREP